ncbi:MAG: Isoquinoline 1-oxidoreductase subunit [Sphingomonas bacterium]|uniref:Isoquinoline 1-oxidoreductase subunit n=1 Tax=Sphingomonas bacterium TaxID=1895847 RepID=UPI002621AE67|nr:Isoquinoline 1-oxidoreductase subunit [Sphingomonas bacterium]MDB5703311.1 Isoquinoline 1-oxidoreductase subunit [Sphingomonas bacterium]
MNARLLAVAVTVLALPVAILAKGAPATLKPPSAFAAIADKDARSVALFREMGKVIQSPRCINCHPRTDRPLQGDDMHPHNPPVTRGPYNFGASGMECTTCHGRQNVTFANGERSIPGNRKWSLAPISMAWEGKSLGEICTQIKDPARNGHKTLAQLIEHNTSDVLVGWGWNPGKGRTPAPGTQAGFGALTKAWVESGAKCPA